MPKKHKNYTFSPICSTFFLLLPPITHKNTTNERIDKHIDIHRADALILQKQAFKEQFFLLLFLGVSFF